MKSFIPAIILSFMVMSVPPAEAASRKNTNTTQENVVSFTPFTGKISGNRVRLRLEPNIDCRIVQEMENGSLLQIVDETADFYSVRPPEGMSAFVYRNYVNDNTIEGSQVNIRLAPNLDSPIIAQLNTGDTLGGVTPQEGSKWLKINVPSQVNFYIAKEYVENVGDLNYLTTLRRRSGEASALIQTAFNNCQEELHKPFEEIDLQEAMASFDKVINDYSDLTEEANRAKELEKVVNETYTQKKIAYLESKANKSSNAKNEVLENALQSYYSRLSQLENMLQEEENNQETSDVEIESTVAENTAEEIAEPIAIENIIVEDGDYSPIEEALYTNWVSEMPGAPSIDDFYLDQKKQAVIVKGTLETYDRPVKHKPGNFVVVNSNKTPIAFVYSTQVNLNDMIGKEVSITASERSNNNFAYPAYYALAVE